MKVSEIKKLLAKAAAHYVSNDEAQYFASEVLETHIRKPSHEKYDLGIINDIKTWKVAKSGVNKTIDLHGYTQYDFKGLGPL
jgi:hypothetical protein